MLWQQMLWQPMVWHPLVHSPPTSMGLLLQKNRPWGGFD
jgi:hypothetical protein